MSAPNILILEGDEEVAADLQSSLELEGYEVAVQAGGPVGLAAARSPDWDLLITASEVEGRDHLAFIDSLRRDEHQLPILVLASDGSTDEQVRALRAGADDWVPRPWSDLELVARVKALLRRARQFRDAGSSNGRGPDEPRRKVETDPSVPRHLLTVRKVGYRWSP
jgi:two-component system, OmpR family, response regulator